MDPIYNSVTQGPVHVGGTFISAITLPLMLMFMAAGAIAVGRFAWSAGSKMFKDSSPTSLGASKKGVSVAVIGGLAALALIPFATYFNPSFKNVTIRTVGSPISSSIIPLPPSSAAGAPSASTSVCADPSVVIANVSQGDVCRGAVCTSFCSIDPSIMNIIKEESVAARLGATGYKIIAALVCRESSGIPTRIGTLAQNGQPDCGLMQINRSSCDSTIMEPRTNIREGISLYKQKLSAASSFSYGGGITREMMAFASYNCCGNEGTPNAKSVSCNPSTGFDQSIPKWACPISPGPGPFGMCAVKAYACDVYACSQRF